jgi:G:T/U-mismatch repair DNA glycosylase
MLHHSALPGSTVQLDPKPIGQAAEASPCLDRITLPSSSPANTTPFTAKLAAWSAIGRFLEA